MAFANDDFENARRVKYWELIADNLSKADWSWGCVSALDLEGRTIWIADAHQGDEKRFVVHADEKLTAFLELELAIRNEWFAAAHWLGTPVILFSLMSHRPSVAWRFERLQVP